MATVGIQNSGKTFAREVEVAIYCALRSDFLSDSDLAKAAKLEMTGPGEISLAPLTPNTIYLLTGYLFDDRERKLTQSEVEQIQSGKVKLFVFGKIAYKDIFDVEHWTTFSVRYRPVDGKYEATNQFNDVDNNRAPPPKEATAPAKGD